MKPFSVVVPVHRRDHERLVRLLLPSLFQNLVGEYDVVVITTDDSMAEVQRMVHDLPVTVVDSREIVPALSALDHSGRKRILQAIDFQLRVMRKAGVRIRYKPELALHGWFRQQLVKLAVAQEVKPGFYLAVDADMICVRRTHIDEIVVDGRAPIEFYKRIPPNQAPWYRWAGDLLQAEPPPVAMAMSPFVFSTQAVQKLFGDLESSVPQLALAKALFRLVYGGNTRGADFLLALFPWTEYSLYHTYLESRGLVDQFYRSDARLKLLGNAVWNKDQLTTWSSRASIEQTESHVFTLIQPEAELTVPQLEAEFAAVFRAGSGL